MITRRSSSGSVVYWHRDHLGSVVAISDPAGGNLQRYAYDAWGARTGGTAGGEERGYTGHEHLVEAGLIHMNGRLYFEGIGRFLQADPFVQAPYDGQSYNRYSYVMNNPLSLTDPSGYFFGVDDFFIAFAVIAGARATNIIDTRTARTLLGMTVAVFIGPSGYWGAQGGLFGNALASTIAGGFAAGGIGGGNIESALQGAFFAAAFYGAGEWSGAHAAGDALAFGSTVHLAQTAAHAVVGCVQAATAGGSCGRGALSAGFAAFAGPALPGEPGSTARLVATVVAGGTASKLSGGNFANGATTAAFGYLFNDMGLEMSVDGSNVPAHESPAPAGLTITISALGMGGAVTLDSFGQVYGSFGTQMPDVLNVSLTYQAVLLDGVTPQSRAALAKKTEHFFKGATVSLGWNGVLLGGGTSMSPGAGHSYDISAGIKLKGGSPIPVAGSASVTPSCFNCPN